MAELSGICEAKTLGDGSDVYRFNEERALAWLVQRAERLVPKLEGLKSLTVRQDVNKLETAAHLVCEYLSEEWTRKLCEKCVVCLPKKLKATATPLKFNQGFDVPKRKFEDMGADTPKPKEDYSTGNKFELSPKKTKETSAQKKLKESAKGTQSIFGFMKKDK